MQFISNAPFFFTLFYYSMDTNLLHQYATRSLKTLENTLKSNNYEVGFTPPSPLINAKGAPGGSLFVF